jgi:hypothetical protein
MGLIYSKCTHKLHIDVYCMHLSIQQESSQLKTPPSCSSLCHRLLSRQNSFVPCESPGCVWGCLWWGRELPTPGGRGQRCC